MARRSWSAGGVALIVLGLALALWPVSTTTAQPVPGPVSCGSVLFGDNPNYRCATPHRERGVQALLIASVGLGVVALAAGAEAAVLAIMALLVVVLVGGAQGVEVGDNYCSAVFAGARRDPPCGAAMRDQTIVTVVPAVAIGAVLVQRGARRRTLRQRVV